jgi:hypothetical protein
LDFASNRPFDPIKTSSFTPSPIKDALFNEIARRTIDAEDSWLSTIVAPVPSASNRK